ncbi:unnamed protein product [Linum trigynum]|uniref:Uncharacterized protein n=1 Tax=Linum trigynum TaxID=586398 RepID=A0AAV2GSQ7_9ROSI
MESKILEINLISAQGLKPQSAKLLQLQTYDVVWIHSAAKLRIQVDRVGGAKPIFLSNDTSGVSVEIYAVGCLRDSLVGTVRFLISNLSLSSPPADTPSFTVLQIRRPSGRCYGVLNIGASVIDAADFTAWKGESVIGLPSRRGVVAPTGRCMADWRLLGRDSRAKE